MRGVPRGSLVPTAYPPLSRTHTLQLTGIPLTPNCSTAGPACHERKLTPKIDRGGGKMGVHSPRWSWRGPVCQGRVACVPC